MLNTDVGKQFDSRAERVARDYARSSYQPSPSFSTTSSSIGKDATAWGLPRRPPFRHRCPPGAGGQRGGGGGGSTGDHHPGESGGDGRQRRSATP